MSLLEGGNFLPGVLTEVTVDYNYGFDASQFGTTDAVVIIGTAFNGPTGVPVEIYNPEHARYVFGKAYDSKTRQEATLVVGIEDAYQRGCRTIYGLRVSGKQLEKTFDFAIETSLKLRLTSAFPTNQAKDYFMVYDNTTGDEKVKIYKPADRATVMEKMQGLVESDNSVLVTELNINRDYGMTKDTSLVDFIQVFNNHVQNNVLRLSIVDVNGVDVTSTSEEARALTIGALFPGLYTIGRDKSLMYAVTNVDYILAAEEGTKPYPSFNDVIYKRIIINTDVSKDLPIFAENKEEFRGLLAQVGVFDSGDFSFLETQGLADRAFAKDKVDYEEVKLSDFELYKRLGSGFAITASIQRRTGENGEELAPRVVETPVSDENRIAQLNDGIYSMLENLNARYRVLTNGHADSVITGKLPRPKDFLTVVPKSGTILDGNIRVIPKIKDGDIATPKKYTFVIDKIEDGKEALYDQIYTKQILQVVPGVVAPDDKTATEEEKANDYRKVVVPEGTLVMDLTDETKAKLKRYNNGAYEDVESSSLIGSLFIVDGKVREGVDGGADGVVFEVSSKFDANSGNFDGKKFVLAENNGKVYALEIKGIDTDGDPSVYEDFKVEPLGDIKRMFSDNEEEVTIYSQSNYFEDNLINIKSGVLSATTLEEFVDFLNKEESLSHLFSFEITSDGMHHKDDYITDIVSETDLNKPATIEEDRELAYDYNKYIPYKTSDNFARQLAQHCTYTSLKTAPTHGIIGISRLADVSLNGVAKRVEQALELDLDLYAKNARGRNMLDRNNMPYPIGRKISVPFTQYYITLSDGYRTISNGAAGYAGMISVLPLDQSSTAQPIDLDSVMFDLTNYQLTRLTQKGFVTIRQSYTRGLVVTDGITMADSASPFRRLSTERIVSAVEELIREATEPFIGKQNHAANRNSLQTAIKSNLEKIKGVLIEDYEFNLVIDPRIMKFSYIDIDYNIVPIYEIREVRNRISVRDEL